LIPPERGEARASADPSFDRLCKKLFIQPFLLAIASSGYCFFWLLLQSMFFKVCPRSLLLLQRIGRTPQSIMGDKVAENQA
jgi:hypothetical protein